MSRTMPRFGLAIGAASIAMAAVAGILWWAPFTGGVVFVAPALFGALAAFVRGAWRLAAVAACLSVCVAIAVVILSAASLPDPAKTLLVLAPFAISLGLGAWLVLDYLRTRDSRRVRELPAWLCTVRARAGVAVGGFSVVAALAPLPGLTWPAFLGPFGIMSPARELLLVFQAGFYLFPFAVLGALTALACGAWRTAALAAFLCIPMFMRLDGLETYPFFERTFMGETFTLVVAGAALVVCLILSHRESRSRRVGRTMPRFGLVVGMASLAMAVADGLVWWAPFAGGMTLVVPALFGALVAFVHGAWRLASVTACLCLCLATAVVVWSGGFLPQPFLYVLAVAPFAISVGLGSWLAFDYRRTGASVALRRLPAWLRAIRDRAGVVVGEESAFGDGVRCQRPELVDAPFVEHGAGHGGGSHLWTQLLCDFDLFPGRLDGLGMRCLADGRAGGIRLWPRVADSRNSLSGIFRSRKDNRSVGGGYYVHRLFDLELPAVPVQQSPTDLSPFRTLGPERGRH